MQFSSLLYVSRSLLTVGHDDQAVDGLVGRARVRNGRLGVTGALMFTHNHFAQCLEGSRTDVDALMESIRHDRRHTEVEVLRRDVSPHRMFSRWDLAYAGPSQFADKQIVEAAAHAPNTSRSQVVERLLWMMREFCTPA